MTTFTAIPVSVKKAVAERDCVNGPATCILCGAPGSPTAHIVRRSQGGMGVEQNIVSLCASCHYKLDEGKDREELKKEVIAYIKGFYPDWTEESVTYHKWRK
jgi:5-methylcytosine-specific restriction endonuclease McrA